MSSQTTSNTTRPTLTPQIDLRDFKDFYWLKEELALFCRQQGLRAMGSKVEISQRIESFLVTKQPPIEEKLTIALAPARKKGTTGPLSLATVITPDYKSDQAHRAFFQSVIGSHFHFTTAFMRFFKENVGKTYQDAVDEWQAEEERKKEPAYQTSLAPQFEYNQFIRDFMADNRDKSLKEAIAAWHEVRQQRGQRKYIPK